MILKFRAWDKEFKEMVQVDALLFDEQAIKATYKNGSVTKEDMKNYVLMQSTGLKDKQGKEIFEGDVLFGHAGENFWEIVEFDTEEGQWIRRDIWCNSKLGLSEYNEFMEIVGNIYENPELLEN